MNNQQAIDLMKGLEQSLDDYCELNDEGKTAFRMAITALEVFGISEQLPSAQPDVLDTNVGDTISRQAAIDALGEEPEVWTGKDEYAQGLNNQWHYDVNALKALPSAQPEYRLDEWCTDCKEYDTEKHCCPRFNQVIRTTLDEMKSERKKGKWETVEDWDGNEHYRCFKCGAEFVLIDGTHVHMNYGNFLRRARLDAGLTQTELAKRMGVTPQYISQYERNNRMPKTETVVKFAKALGTPENNDYYFCPHCGTRMTEEDA